jgi:hypothetical protein
LIEITPPPLSCELRVINLIFQKRVFTFIQRHT